MIFGDKEKFFPIERMDIEVDRAVLDHFGLLERKKKKTAGK